MGRPALYCSLALLLPLLFFSIRAEERPSANYELKALDKRFSKLIDPKAKLQKMAGGFGFTEGPVWDSKGFVYVSDEEKNRILRVYPDGRSETLISLGDPDGSTFDRKLQLIDCASVLRAIIRLTPDGKYQVLADRYEGRRFNSPNDVIVGPDDALYFTDPTLDLPKGEKQEISFQGVYRLGADGSVSLLTRDLSQPNGLAFSPDGQKFYVDDSDRREIRVYDVAPDGGIRNGKLFGKEEDGTAKGVPDGMRVDTKGNLFVTGPSGIWVWSAAGEHLGTIDLPETAANLTWGDPDYRTLYITASTSVYRLRTKTHGFVPYLRQSSTKRLVEK